MNNKKKCGILMHISSLHNKTGIGSLGECAYKFIDFLKDSNQNYWQILPIGHTSYGDSPYQTYSIYAGNPYFIDLDLLIKEGLLKENEIIYNNEQRVNYGFLYNTRYSILRKACQRFDFNNKQYLNFLQNNEWVLSYSIFMALKEKYCFKPLNEWDEKYRCKNNDIVNEMFEKHRGEIDFWCFIQYKFFEQWFNLKKYANDNGVQIIGDVPIYVPYDSVEVWEKPENFMLDSRLNMIYLSGAPADKFAPNGQIWGSPLYNYDYMKRDNFQWWINRLKYAGEIFDIIRLDHFLGFDSFYAVDAKTKDAKNGLWIKAPGFEIFTELKKYINSSRIIAEDLGKITETSKKLLDYTGFYGMRILQFGLYGDERNMYFPNNYDNKCVAYTGTHDNPTLKEWLEKIDYHQKKYIVELTKTADADEQINVLISMLFTSRAEIIIIPLQDYLHLGFEARMNEPGKAENNWTWMAKTNEINRKLSLDILQIIQK